MYIDTEDAALEGRPSLVDICLWPKVAVRQESTKLSGIDPKATLGKQYFFRARGHYWVRLLRSITIRMENN